MTDFYRVLGVTHDADDAAIRAAYLAAVRHCSPDRDAKRFAQLHKAYDALATAQSRRALDLFDSEPPTLEEVIYLLQEQFTPRRPTVATLLCVIKG